jgi:hypothetical protein
MNKEIIYAGLYGVEMTDNQFNLGEGIYIRKTYAHLFAPFMMAFKPPGKHKHHEGPWKAAKGGFSFDISAEIELPRVAIFDKLSGQEDGVWLIASLFRLSSYPFLNVPALSDISFNLILDSVTEPSIYPFETKHRIFEPPDKKIPVLSEDNLQWVKGHRKKTAELMVKNPKLYSAFKAFDSATVHGKVSSSLLSIWGAIEQLFSSNTGELKYRVSANLASFLTERGDKRLELFKELSKLYNDRSTAAHTSKELEHSPLVSSYIHLRNALIKIVETGVMPTQESLEEIIFK